MIVRLAAALLILAGCSGDLAPERDAAVDAPLLHDGSSPDALFGRVIDPASACGNPTAPCCPGGQCAAGGCCVEGRCTAEGATCEALAGTCQRGSCGPCGGPRQPCCAGGACTSAGLRCLGGACEPCGDLGQLCCPQGACLRAGTACSLAAAGAGAAIGVCVLCEGSDCAVACGQPGQPCCAGAIACQGGGCCVEGTCVAAGSACQVGGAAFGACAGGSCSCGGAGQACCPAAIAGQRACAAVETACIMPDMPPAPALCSKCGGPGEPCCAFNRCDGGCCSRMRATDPGTCVPEGQDCANGAVCVQGACGMCGGAGQLCCDGRCSAAGTSCATLAGQGARCQRCGGRGQPCCFDQPGGDPCAPALACRGGLCLER